MGGIEYSFLTSPNQGSSDPKYSDALRIGLFSDRGLPFGMSFDFGFLNKEKQRYTRFGVFNFGKQPTISVESPLGFYYRAELLSFNWKEGGSFHYSPGLELGVTFPLSAQYGIGLFSKLTLEPRTNGDNNPWGQEDGPKGIFWLGINLLQMNHYRATASPE
ncbi:hypothetical protein AZI86_13440 [Bdellovibrio bacteriovorus]|uniref:Uncharacterized protein n=2 Tax=Bdellovibrio bacteriovorus TaxID=959 RepID=A0A150WJE6_BDEBC|nr:hypothetical protein AZI86_13440 [Bdellovibrio bacteriovorus]